MSNLCRDESCMILEDKIESVFGSCFSTHGLGGVLTCGVIGMKAGLSHSPVEGVSQCPIYISDTQACAPVLCLVTVCAPISLTCPPPPYISQGKERYVFFSFPHIAIDSGELTSRADLISLASFCAWFKDEKMRTNITALSPLSLQMA